MKRQALRFFVSTAILAAAPAFVAPAQVPVPAAPAQAPLPVAPAQALSLPTASAVASVYDRWQMKPLWFQGSIPAPAAAKLLEVLRLSQFDGLASGPVLAAQVDSAIARAASGDPAALKAAERTLSSAWVHYVQTLKRPTAGMIYAYKTMEPQGTRPDLILAAAASAPSLVAHMQQVSNLNPVYAQIKAAAIAEARAAGNLTPDPRVLANLDRARSIPAGGRFVLIDAASQRLWMYENGVPVDSMKVIVGELDQPTPMIASYMHYVTFNPYWNAPNNLMKTIARRAASEGERYLKSRGYQVMSDWTRDATVIPADQVNWKAVAAGRENIRIRQLPGEENFMGKLKFPFPNGQDIYLHDTPAIELFAKSNRAISNGCIRLEDAQRFGRWLLGREPVAASAAPEQQVQLARGVPIIVTYLTAQPKDGILTYLDDVYGWDSSPALAIAAANMVSRE